MTDTSATAPDDPAPTDDVLAAELAFGLLDAAEFEAAEKRAAADVPFATAVARWREHLVGLLPGAAIADQAPRPAVWATIAAAIGPDRGIATLALRRSLRRWQAASAGLAAIAATLLGLLLVRPQPAAPTPPPVRVEGAQLVALLDPGTAPLQGAATYDAVSRRITVRLRHLRPDARVPELWLIGADGKPRSLGVIGTPEVWTRRAPDNSSDRLARGVTLAISLEPDRGSPTGSPTGPVILSGKLS